MPRKIVDADLLTELPPIDGGDDDGQDAAPDDADLDVGSEPDEQDLDDTVAEELPVGELVAQMEEQALPGGDDSRDLDIGAVLVDVREESGRRSDDDAAGLAGDDASVGIDHVTENGSVGTETDELPGASGDDIDEGEFPELDADDGAELPGLLEDGVELEDEAALPGWGAPWAPCDSPPLPGPLTCIIADGDRIAAAGRELFVLQPGPGEWQEQRAALLGEDDVEFVALALHGTALWAVSRAHALRFVHDAASFESVPSPLDDSEWAALGWTASVPPAMCGLRSSGQVMSYDPQTGWKASRSGVIAIASERTAVHALVRQAGGCTLDRLGPAGWTHEADVPGAWESDTLLACQGDVVALANRAGDLSVSFDAGRHWLQARVPPQLSSLAIAAGRVVGATFRESEDKSYLFVMDEGGMSHRVAELGGTGLEADDDESEGRGRVTGLAWDERRGCLWVVGSFGLRAFLAPAKSPC